MTLSQILVYSANMLDDGALRSVLLGQSTADSAITETIQSLIWCANQINIVIASDYMPIYKTKTLSSDDGKISFSSIDSGGVLSIKNVKVLGRKVKFEILDGKLVTSPGSVLIKYCALPSALSAITDDYTQFQCISPLVLAYGITAEYLFAKGNIEDAHSWNKRFLNAINGQLRGRNAAAAAQRWY